MLLAVAQGAEYQPTVGLQERHLLVGVKGAEGQPALHQCAVVGGVDVAEEDGCCISDVVAAVTRERVRHVVVEGHAMFLGAG